MRYQNREPLNVILAQDINVGELDLHCLRNIYKLTEFHAGNDYQDGSFFMILERLFAYLTNDHVEGKRKHLYPRQIKDIVRQEKSREALSNIENIVADLFTNFEEIDMLFEPKFDQFKFKSSIVKKIKYGKPNSFSHDMSDINRIPKHPTELLHDMNELLESSNHFVDSLAFEIIKHILEEETNPENASLVWDGFTVMFENPKDFDFHCEWFFKKARCGDVSNNGDLDMAYHSAINQSDIVHALLDRYQKLM